MEKEKKLLGLATEMLEHGLGTHAINTSMTIRTIALADDVPVEKKRYFLLLLTNAIHLYQEAEQFLKDVIVKQESAKTIGEQVWDTASSNASETKQEASYDIN